MRNFRVFLILLLFTGLTSAQKVDIVKQLKMIEQGKINQAQVDLENLKSEYPDNPDIIFLDAVLTSDGKIALEKYSRIYNIYPDSRFADAAVYRIFSFYYSLGQYNEARNYKMILEDEYPESPYIKIAGRNLNGINLAELNNETVTLSEEKIENQIPVIKSRPKTSDGFKYTIQAGAFISIDNAARLNSQFADRGYPTHILKKDIAGSILNIVTVGEFDNIDEARTALQSINSEYNIKGRIIRPEDYK